MGGRALPNFTAAGTFTKRNISKLPQRQALAKGFGAWGAKFKVYSTQNLLWKIATNKLGDHICSICVPLTKENPNAKDFSEIKNNIISLTQAAGRGAALLSSQAKLQKNPGVLDHVLNDLNGLPIIGPPLVTFIKNQKEYKEDKTLMAQIISANTNKSELRLFAEELLNEQKCDIQKVSLLRNAILSGTSKRQMKIVTEIFPMGTRESDIVGIVEKNRSLLQNLSSQDINNKIDRYGDLFGLIKREYKCIKDFGARPEIKILTYYINIH